MAGDVRKRNFCQKAVKQTVKSFGKIDILVNAAFQLHTDDFEDLTEEHFDETRWQDGCLTGVSRRSRRSVMRTARTTSRPSYSRR